MPIANRVHLLTLADREFRRESETPRAEPPRRNFKGMKLNLSKFEMESGWDRKRGAAARLTGVLLRQDAAALHERVCADEQALKTYDGAADWLQREARYLRKVASMQETVVSRLNAVLAQCRKEREETPSQTA